MQADPRPPLLAVYVAGVMFAADPKSLGAVLARTPFLPRTNPVAEAAATSSAASPLTNG